VLVTLVAYTGTVADGLLLLETSMTDRVSEIGRYFGMEMNVGKTKMMRISRQQLTKQIIINHKELEDVIYFN
jgi:hypothetical protein